MCKDTDFREVGDNAATRELAGAQRSFDFIVYFDAKH
jgi:hypothetical protein